MSETLKDASRLYKQLAETLEHRIADGTYPVGTLLPSQNDLGTEFNVSRPTVIEALRELKQKGLIDTQPGRGSVVKRSRPDPDALMAPPRVYRVLDGGEQDGGTELLVAGIVATPPQIAHALSISAGPKSFLRQYVRHHPEVPSEPIELVSLWFPLSVFDGNISGTAFASATPPDESIRKHFEDRDLPLDYVQEEISSRSASEHEASALHVEHGAPVLDILTTCWSHMPLAYAPLLAFNLVMSGENGTLRTKFTLADLCWLCTAETAAAMTVHT